MVICSEVQCAYRSADATAAPSCLASLKSSMVYLSGAGLPKPLGMQASIFGACPKAG